MFKSLSTDGFQRHMENSRTAFFGKANKDGNLVLEQVGMLADAKLQVGDALIAAFPMIERSTSLLMRHPEDRERILKWDFADREIVVIYERQEFTYVGTMKNPIYKEKP